jgi:hypothetical protein
MRQLLLWHLSGVYLASQYHALHSMQTRIHKAHIQHESQCSDASILALAHTPPCQQPNTLNNVFLNFMPRQAWLLLLPLVPP